MAVPADGCFVTIAAGFAGAEVDSAFMITVNYVVWLVGATTTRRACSKLREKEREGKRKMSDL